MNNESEGIIFVKTKEGESKTIIAFLDLENRIIKTLNQGVEPFVVNLEIKGVFNQLGSYKFFNCTFINGRKSFNTNLDSVKISFHVAIKDVEVENFLIKQVNIVCSSFSKWYSFKNAFDFSEDEGASKVDIPKDLMTLKVENDGDSVEFWETATGEYGWDEIIGQKKVVLEFSYKDGLILDEFLDLLKNIRKFILFLTNQDPFLDSISVKLDGQDHKFGFSKVHIQQDEVPYRRYAIHLNGYKMMPDLNNVTHSWFFKKEYFNTIDVLLQHRLNKTLSQVYFLNCCIAVESLENEIYKGRIRQIRDRVEDHDKNKAIINGLQIPTELKNILKTKSKEDTKVKFKEKFDILEELIKDIGQSYLTKKFPDKGYDDFIKVTANQRNHMVHRGVFLEQFDSFFDLHGAALVIDLALQIYLIEHLGLRTEETLQYSKDVARKHIKDFITQKE